MSERIHAGLAEHDLSWQVARQDATPTPTLRSPSSTSDRPQPTQPLLFNNPSDLNMCTPALVSWVYTIIDDSDVSLSINNIDVPQGPPPTSTTTSTSPMTITRIGPRQNPTVPSVNRYLATVKAGSMNYSWPQVNVPQGWYQFAGALFPAGDTDPTQLVKSRRFFVSGGDTACLMASSSAPFSNPTSRPSTMGSASKVRTGAIVGGVIGGAAFLIVIVIALVYACTGRRARWSRRKDSDGSWGGLKSMDSQKSFTANRPFAAAVSRASGGSVDTGGKPPHSSVEDILASQEKVVPPTPPAAVAQSPKNSSYAIGVHPLPYNNRRASLHATYRGPSPNTGGDKYDIEFSPFNVPTREGSRPRANTLTSVHARSASSRQSPDREPPPMPSTPTRRDAFAGRVDYVELEPMSAADIGQPTKRAKTPRKPVKYDSLDSSDTPASSYNGSSILDVGSPSSPSVLSSLSNAHSADASFLPKPVHYLIPDMPPPRSARR
jgi:hypothetical protein